MKLSTALKPFIPPALMSLVRKIRGRRNSPFHGEYSSWQAAQDASGGYDVPVILNQVRAAGLKVKRGEALFERDSVCFYHPAYRWPTVACLLRVAAEHGGVLRVLDFGGSLGSFYWQHRVFFKTLSEVRWAVVEQSHFVECGRSEFQDVALCFYGSVAECLAEGGVDVILCSSSLQYLEKPYKILAAFASSNVPYILVDRTPFISRDQDRLTVQQVPPSIYPASYPVWLFSWGRFVRELDQLGFKIELDFYAEDDLGIGEFKGVFLART